MAKRIPKRKPRRRVTRASTINWDEVDSYIRGGRNLHAIKCVRDQTGCTLRKAKDIVETRKREIPDEFDWAILVREFHKYADMNVRNIAEYDEIEYDDHDSTEEDRHLYAMTFEASYGEIMKEAEKKAERLRKVINDRDTSLTRYEMWIHNITENIPIVRNLEGRYPRQDTLNHWGLVRLDNAILQDIGVI